MKKVLIRADDLGYSEGINLGIKKAVADGILRNVGLMPNMEWAEQGVQMLKPYEVCFGQHTNISAGKPLNDPKYIPSLVNPGTGEFKSSKEYRTGKDDIVVLEEVILEIEAQYQRFVELVGKKPCYFEGHAVSSDNFYKGLKIVAERHGLHCLVADSDGMANGMMTYVKFRNTYIHTFMESLYTDYDPFSTLQKACDEECDDHHCTMMICHPGYLDASILRNSSLTLPRPMETEMLCADRTKKWLLEQDIKLLTFEEIA